MASFDFVIDDSMVGQTIGPPDGFLVSLTRTVSPVHETPRWSEGKRKWLSGYLQIRGSNDYRDLVCLDAANPSFAFGVAVNHSLGYRGGLIVVCVPRQSQWKITLSDVPNVGRRAAAPTARQAA